MKFDTIHHVAIIVSNYDISKNFYVNILNFEIVREEFRSDRDDYILNLKSGNIILEIFIMNNHPKRLSYPEAYGLRHLAFKVDDIVETVRELNEKGISTEPISHDKYANNKMTFFKDPDGLPLELHE